MPIGCQQPLPSENTRLERCINRRNQKSLQYQAHSLAYKESACLSDLRVSGNK